MSEQAQQARGHVDEVVTVINPHGAGRVVLVCEHATNAIPPEFNGLGLDGDALKSHIAWDIGALAVAETMSAKLDAPLIAHRVSRLVFDCNRAPDAPDAIPDISEYQDIPGNTGLSDAHRLARTARYYTPFCDTLGACIEERIAAADSPQAAPVLITVHSFTPVYKGERREVEIGILHDSDTRLADQMLKHAMIKGDYTVMRNSPYGPEDGVTFTLVRHALPHGLLNVMIEIRNDLIADGIGQQTMARKLVEYVNAALATQEGEAGVSQVKRRK